MALLQLSQIKLALIQPFNFGGQLALIALDHLRHPLDAGLSIVDCPYPNQPRIRRTAAIGWMLQQILLTRRSLQKVIICLMWRSQFRQEQLRDQ